jgi:hypothetical protein
MNEFSKIAFDIRQYLHNPPITPSNRGSLIGSIAGRVATTPATLGLGVVAGSRAYGDYTGHTAPTQFLNDAATDIENTAMSGANAVGASAADLVKNFDVSSAYDTLKRVFNEHH